MDNFSIQYAAINQPQADTELGGKSTYTTPVAITNSDGANFARLSMLVINPGTDAVASVVKRNLPDGLTLDETLEARYKDMENLVYKNVINRSQFEVLYPLSGDDADEGEIDMTLWVVLLRNITANAKQVNRKWKEEPQPWQRQFWHDVQRLKNIRNKLAHNRKAELDQENFTKKWRETESVLLRLDVPPAIIEDYLSRELEPERARKAVQEVKDQFLNDISALLIQRKDQNKKLKILMVVIASVIAVLVIVSVVVTVTVVKPWRSCAKNIISITAGDALVSYLTREGWGGRTPDYAHMDKLKTPAQYVIVSHTAQVLSPCYTTDECCMTVRKIQDFNMDVSHWADIAYNYVFGGDGVIFMGRGPKYQGAAALHWNNKSISVGFIGLFKRRAPSDESLDALDEWLQYLVDHDIIAVDYTIYGLCQVRAKFPDAPGAAFMKLLEEMFPNHWKNDNISNCNMASDQA